MPISREVNQQNGRSTFPPNPAKGETGSIPATNGTADRELLRLQESVEQRLCALDIASSHVKAEILAGEAQGLHDRAKQLAEVIETYRNPEVEALVAYQMAIDNLAKKKPQRLFRTVSTGYCLALPGSESAPDFSAWFLPHGQSSSREQAIAPSHRIAASSEEIGKEPASPGKPEPTAGKGFSAPQKN